MCEAQNAANYKAPGNSNSYLIPEHPLESVCTDFFSTPAVTVKDLGSNRSTGTLIDAVLMRVDRHAGYTVAAPTTKGGLTEQPAAKLLYHNCVTVFDHPGKFISDKGIAFMSS